MDRRLRTGAAVLAALLAAAGIYVAVDGPVPHAANTGPLGAGGNYGQDISAPCSGSLITDGNNAFRNAGQEPVMIHSISLLRPHGMKLLRAYVVLVTPNSRGVSDLHGLSPGVPPANDPPGDHYPWFRHKPAIGTPIRYYRDRRWYTNLLLIIKTTGHISSYRGVNVYYSADGQNYQWHELSAVKVTRRCP